MTRRLLWLNGLAILAVVANHAAGWGYIALFWWADRYRQVTVPDYSAVGSLAYYGLLLLKQLTIFSVPVFLFTSGFFTAYMARDCSGMMLWRRIGIRLLDLVIPYCVWSVAIFAVDALDGVVCKPLCYISQLLTGSATPAYFFIPLLCQLYLLAPLIIRAAQAHWKGTLIASGLIQACTLSAPYIGLVWPSLGINEHTLPIWFFPRYLLFFTYGITHASRVFMPKERTASLQHPPAAPESRHTEGRGLQKGLSQMLTLGVVLWGAMTIAEADLVFRVYHRDWMGGAVTLVGSLYALCFLLWFTLKEGPTPPGMKRLSWLGSQAFPIYLVHPKVIEITARAIGAILPWLLPYQLPFQAILIGVAIVVPLGVRMVITQPFMRGTARYLLG